MRTPTELIVQVIPERLLDEPIFAVNVGESHRRLPGEERLSDLERVEHFKAWPAEVPFVAGDYG